MTTILRLLQYARADINRSPKSLELKTGLQKLERALALLEQGYPADADIDNLPNLTAPAVVETERKEEGTMGPKRETPAGKNSGSTKAKSGKKEKPTPSTPTKSK